MDHQQVLVDQRVGQQRADQGAAAHDDEVAARPRLQLDDGVGDVAVKEGRVRPWSGAL